MTESVDGLTIEKKYVLVFDFCSSTSILEDLIRSESQRRWRDLLIDIKNFLIAQHIINDFTIYKFIGDGWILLFDDDFPPRELFSLMKCLCKQYDRAFKKRIKGVLSTEIDNIGITFGLDMGSLIRIVMNRQSEYIGRSINMAARLQGAIKDKDSKPQGKVLMTKLVYDFVKRDISKDYKNVYSVKRKLRNISGGEKYHAVKLEL